MRSNCSKKFAAALAVSAGLTASVRAAVIVSTLADPAAGPAKNVASAAEFTMDSTAATLTDVQANVGGPNGGAAQSVDMAIYSDNSGTPGTLLLDLGTDSPATIVTTSTFNAAAPFVLLPDTTYWVLGSATGSNSTFNWRVAGSATFTSDPTINALYDRSGTYTGGTAAAPTGFTLITPAEALIFQVDGTAAVPEPASVGLLAAGSVGLLVRRRRAAGTC